MILSVKLDCILSERVVKKIMGDKGMSLRKKILTRTKISVLIFALYLLPTTIDLWEENITFFLVKLHEGKTSSNVLQCHS